MANPYQTALMQRFTPNPRNSGFFGGNAGADVAETRGFNAPVLQPPPETPTLPPETIDTKAPTNTFRDRLLGFDAGKLDAGKNDPKYVFAKYAQNFDDRDASSRDALINALRGDASGFFKDARLEGDILKGSYDPDTGGYGDVDIIKGLKAGGEGWQWGAMPGSVTGGGAVPPTVPMDVPPPVDWRDVAVSNDPQGGGVSQPAMDPNQRSPFLEALLQQLGGLA